MGLPWPPHYTPDDVKRRATQNGVVAVHVDDLDRWTAKIQSAFDFGYKAAGGTIIPDDARDTVELTLTRTQIQALATAAEETISDGILSQPEDEALTAFLETISIYRRKK